MKKKFLITTILLASMCTAIVGCNSNTTNEQLEAEILSEIEALPDEAIENDSEVKETESEEETESEDIESPEDVFEEGDWVYGYFPDDNDHYKVQIDKTYDIRRDFPINDRSTFGELSDICKKYDMNFSEKVFNDLFAINYFSEDAYTQTFANHDEYETIILVTKFYMISCFMGSNNLTIDNAYIDATANTRLYHCTDKDGNLFDVTWDVPAGTLTAYAPSTGKSMDAGINLNDEMVLLTYSIEVREGYKYDQKEQTVEEQPTEQVEQVSEQVSDGSTLEGYEYIKGKESEIVAAIEKYFNSTIASVKDTSTSYREGAIITMANGKECEYYGNSSVARITVYEKGGNSVNIWEK